MERVQAQSCVAAAVVPSCALLLTAPVRHPCLKCSAVCPESVSASALLAEPLGEVHINSFLKCDG